MHAIKQETHNLINTYFNYVVTNSNVNGIVM